MLMSFRQSVKQLAAQLTFEVSVGLSVNVFDAVL